LSAVSLFLSAQPTHREDTRPADDVSGVVNTAVLDPVLRERIDGAVRNHEYSDAETMLVDEINKKPKSFKLLCLAGQIFFLDRNYLNSAIAYNKAATLEPLDEDSRFILAMSYIKLNRYDWARPELENLTQTHPKNALYLYWLSRLDYNRMSFAKAIEEAQKAIAVDPSFMRAYENLGLCYEAVGKYERALTADEEAVRLNRRQRPGSAWPPLNLGVLLVKMGKLDLARKYLSEALSFDPGSPEAHYQSGLVLEKQHLDSMALAELRRAVELRPSYAEPYYVMGRVYHRDGAEADSARAFATFERLRVSETHELSP
jgi:tetratricopeptide (TPR) repeat protein